RGVALVGAAPPPAAGRGAAGRAVGGAAGPARRVARDLPELPGARPATAPGQHRHRPRGGSGSGAAGCLVDRAVPVAAAAGHHAGGGRSGGQLAGSDDSATQIGAVAVSDQLLELERMSVRFLLGRRGAVRAVTDASLSLRPGQVTALIGESGCGKSVLAAALLGLLPANAQVRGRALLADGTDLLSASDEELTQVRGRQVGLVPQSA